MIGAEAAASTEAFLARLGKEWSTASRSNRRSLLDELTARIGPRRDERGGRLSESSAGDASRLKTRLGLTPKERFALGTWLRETLASSPQDPELAFFLASSLWAQVRPELRIVTHHALRDVRGGYLDDQRSRSLWTITSRHSQDPLGSELLRAWLAGQSRRRARPVERDLLLHHLPTVESGANGARVAKSEEAEAKDSLIWDALRIQARFDPMLTMTRPRGIGRDETGAMVYEVAVPQQKGATRYFIRSGSWALLLRVRVPIDPAVDGPKTSEARGFGMLTQTVTPSGEPMRIVVSRPFREDEPCEVLFVSEQVWSAVGHRYEESFRADEGGPKIRSESSGLLHSHSNFRDGPFWRPFQATGSHAKVGPAYARKLRVEGPELTIALRSSELPALRSSELPPLRSREPTNFRTLFLEHACVGDNPATWELSLNGGRPLRFIAQPCPRAAKLRLPPGLLKPSNNTLTLRRISGGPILIDTFGLR